MYGYAFLKWSKRLVPLLVACATFAGCLADNGPIVQVVPRVVLAPQNPRFQAIPPVSYNPPAGSMLVKWNRSIADTQLNFKGYFVKLWTSIYDTVLGSDDLHDSLAATFVGRTVRPVPDTSCVFTQTKLGASIPLGRYTVVVHGVKANDSGTLGLDSSEYSGQFDPRPLTNPTNLRATSLGPNQIGLRWTPSPSDTNAGFFRYVIYYRDTTKNHGLFVDTGKAIATNVKFQSTDSTHWNDSTITVSVPGVTPQNGTTTEWPYQFWVKSERNDSTFFYGSDTNSETWAGAQNLTSPGVDSGGWGGIHNSTFIGSFNQAWAIVDDSNRSDRQVMVTINDNDSTVTLTAENNSAFLLDNSTGTARMDTAYSLGSIYYKYPYATPSEFSVQSVTLPEYATSTGIVLYLMIPDPLIGNKPEWARLFITRQSGGTFINSTNGIHCDASFQPALSNDGSQHLPYY